MSRVDTPQESFISIVYFIWRNGLSCIGKGSLSTRRVCQSCFLVQTRPWWFMHYSPKFRCIIESVTLTAIPHDKSLAILWSQPSRQPWCLTWQLLKFLVGFNCLPACLPHVNPSKCQKSQISKSEIWSSQNLWLLRQLWQKCNLNHTHFFNFKENTA